jgi:hypothetical protein
MSTFSSWIRFIPDDSRPVTPALVHEPSAATGPGGPGVFIEWGPPLPERYDRAFLRLLVQDPYRLFCYWELDAATLQRHFPPDIPPHRQNHLILMLRNLTEDAAMPLLVGAAQTWWLHVNPDREYRTTLEVLTPDGRHETLLASNEVRTPRETVSWVVEPFDLLREENMAYLQLLSLSGAEPVDRDFLEMLRRCQVYDQPYRVPDFLLRHLPDWLRGVIRHLDRTVPRSIFADFVLRRFFPESLHAAILDNPDMTPAEFDALLGRLDAAQRGTMAFAAGQGAPSSSRPGGPQSAETGTAEG